MLRNSLNGVFSVYKPKGLNSRKATDYVQLALSNELLGRTSSKLKRNELIKIGHGGTLVTKTDLSSISLVIHYIKYRIHLLKVF